LTRPDLSAIYSSRYPSNSSSGGNLLALQLEKDKRCFVCGVENPHSLKVKVEQADI
jgi:hypothetical protein